MNGTRVFYALTGSFCTFELALGGLAALQQAGAVVTAVMSYNAATLDTRFGTAASFRRRLEDMTGKPVLCTLQAVEPIGPRRLADMVVVAPCTGNTLSKLALGITDTPVLMACKSQLRGGGPVLLAISTNDALSGSGQNFGRLMNTKNVYFVPMAQDAPLEKGASLSADYGLLCPAARAALAGRQLQPVFVGGE